MASLRELKERLSADNVDSVFNEALKQASWQLVDSVRFQIERGISFEGSMPAYASVKYAEKKDKMGSLAPLGITDLKYTGSFLRKLYFKKYTNTYLIRSNDWKNSLILEKYGPEIFVPTEDSLNDFVQELLLPTILYKLKK